MTVTSLKSPGVVSTRHDAERLDQNPNVERQRPIAQILEVALDTGSHLGYGVGIAA
jgi:hypothetical protein